MEIKKYKLGDEKEILSLFNLSFGKEMSLEYWKWRFLNNPTQDSPMIYLMWGEEKLIGHYAVSSNRILVNNQVYKSALSMTTMTHPDYGGRGIFTKLASELYKNEYNNDNLDVVWGFPNNNSHRGFIKNLKWKDIGVVPTFSLNVSSFRFKKLAIANYFYKVERINEHNVEIYSACQKGYSAKILKDAEFFNWRFVDNPIENYVIFENEESCFFIAKLFKNDKSNEIDIVEWSVPNDFEQTNQAINTILSFFSDIEIHKINIWMPLVDKRHLDFEKLGFTNSLPLTYLGYGQFNNQINIDPNNWFYQMGDSDVY